MASESHDNRAEDQGASSIDDLTREVSDHLQFNLNAYGKVWTGEDEDTRFICGPLVREVERLRSELFDAHRMLGLYMTVASVEDTREVTRLFRDSGVSSDALKGKQG